MKSAYAPGFTIRPSFRLPAPAARLLAEFLEYRRVRREIAGLPPSLLRDIGVGELEFRQAASSFRTWRGSRFGHGAGPGPSRPRG